MTPLELKETLLKQYNDAFAAVQRIEGAIQACNSLLNEEDNTETPTEVTTDETDA